MVNILTYIEDSQGSYMGASMASAANRFLSNLGIDPNSLDRLPGTSGNNTAIFALEEQLVARVCTDLENHQSSGEANDLLLKPRRNHILGFDQGSVPVKLEICCYMSAEGVLPEHVQALSREVFNRGSLFHDNKLSNVRVTPKSQLPYVVDRGALMPAAELERRGFLYPENSGYDRTHGWKSEGAKRFDWPDSQDNLPEVQELESLLKELSLKKGTGMLAAK